MLSTKIIEKLVDEWRNAPLTSWLTKALAGGGHHCNIVTFTTHGHNPFS